MSTDGGAFAFLTTVRPATPSSTFTGQAGNTYGFYSIATDNAGNVQPTPAGAQQTVQIVAPVTLVSIAVTPTNPSIAKGLTEQFTATGTFTDGSTEDLTGSVDLGIGQPLGRDHLRDRAWHTRWPRAQRPSRVIGRVTVSDTTTLTVTRRRVTSIAVTPANPSVAKGLTEQFTATGTYTDGTTANLTSAGDLGVGDDLGRDHLHERPGLDAGHGHDDDHRRPRRDHEPERHPDGDARPR